MAGLRSFNDSFFLEFSRHYQRSTVEITDIQQAQPNPITNQVISTIPMDSKTAADP